MARDRSKGYAKGQNGDGAMSKAAQEEISRALVRILRYETRKYGIPEQGGWVDLHELMEKSGLQQKPEEVIFVANTSEGSQGRRFEVEMMSSGQFRLRATYKHQGNQWAWKAKSDKNDKNDVKFPVNEGWDSYQGVSTWRQPIGSEDPSWDPWRTDAPSTSKPSKGGKGSSQIVGRRRSPDGHCSGQSSQVAGLSPSKGRKDQDQAEKEQGKLKGASRESEGVPSKGDAEAFDISTPRSKEEKWEKFIDPGTKRAWLYHRETEDFFFEDCSSQQGWKKYTSDLGHWWFHETGRWFFDPQAV
ncbi:unnamed protein product [Effrenium voratum]|nr:unnamed protein product [Effrenium voratum]